MNNKDYLNKNEAADYMCMSLSGFKNLAKAYNIPSAKIPGGRVIYRKSDLQRLNEQYFDAPFIQI